MYKAVVRLNEQYLGLTKDPCRVFDMFAKFHRLSGALCQKSNVKCQSPDCPQMPPCDFKAEEYKGMSKDRIMEIRKHRCNPMVMKVTYYNKPVCLTQGYMQWLWDTDGRRYLDLFAGIATVSVGHCHPKVTEAAEKQLRCLWHTSNIYMTTPLHEYTEKLTAHLPDQLKVVYLTNSGSEANDLAMLMARLHTGNFDIITFRGSYHGGSPQTLGLTSYAAYKYPIANGFGCHTTMCPDVFRGLWGGSHCRDSPVQTIRQCSCDPGCCQANNMYIEQLKEVLASSVPSRIAGFFGEPIQGVGGAVQYPKNYLKEAYKLVRERGGVCIADEVQTGFGRTGSHFWGFEGHGVIPDMVTMAKGIANGFPMGAVITTQEIANSFAKGIHFNTFSGSPLACTIASSVLDTIREDGTQQTSATVGTYLLTELAKLREKYEIIGDVRGKGLQIGVEMVKDKESRAPLPAEAISQIFEDVKDMGVLIGKGGAFGQVFRIQPPMCISRDDADFFLAVFSCALQRYMESR
ncbi:alanine--glyoxylate aminotransferase 2, mitochondrial isoform X1 [Scleropages formosus]|uniref:Alanine--glyoxylate aminotransferase 2, mitochondrial n=2 Tax=Scleropages formosus TaxID=113540 RepID=A0A8C9SDG8_SCLFO|nr:alanine--glyoxylate aminotransferase 2, mitochondrial isoform X1 [Scleropages formosus]